MIGKNSIAIVAIVGFLVKECRSSYVNNYVENYFEKPDNNQFGLNVLPEYKIERYVFPSIFPNSSNDVIDNDDSRSPDNTILYRIPSGPKSPRNPEKKVAFIQHGILCDDEPCTVNKLQIAIVYLLVDQGYDVWLGLSNSSMLENSISNEIIERKRLENVARSILTSTKQTELLVMGYFNGTVQFFGMSAPSIAVQQSKFSKWLEYIPGVQTVKKWYYKAKNYVNFSGGYKKVVEGFDLLGKEVDVIIDDPSVEALKNTVLRAWGFVTSMVTPTMTINDFSEMINQPDVYLDVPQLITKYGYKAESHQVITDDGYLLSVHRISGGEKYPPKKGKPVVYLQHGMMGSSAAWIVTGPAKSLGYQLADEGYDVWMGNARGNTYSRGHVNMSTEDSDFWNFSFHEMGYYDLPATIDHIIATTEEKKINYIGHSQGTTAFFVMLSEKPEYNDKIIKFVAYAPVIYANNVRSPIIKLLSTISAPIYRALKYLNVHDFLPTNALLMKIGRKVCEARTKYQVVCSNTFLMVTGYDSTLIDKTTVPIILGHFPAGSSVKQLFHYGQEFKSKKFRQFDYGDKEKNIEKYGQSEPPEYKIENVKIPLAIFYASSDWLADSRDVERLARDMPNSTMIRKVPFEHFNHIDFLFAMEASALIYRPTIEYLRS